MRKYDEKFRYILEGRETACPLGAARGPRSKAWELAAARSNNARLKRRDGAVIGRPLRGAEGGRGFPASVFW